MYDAKTVQKTLADTEAALGAVESGEKVTGKDLYAAADAYRRVCQLYAYLATFYNGTVETKQATRLVHYGRRLLYGKQRSRLRRAELTFFKRIPGAFSKIKAYTAFSAAVGITSAALAAIMVFVNPEFGWNFLSEETAQSLRNGTLWTEQIRGMSAMSSSKIAANNIKVSFMAFAFGITGGVLTVVLLVFNGALLGGMFAALSPYNMASRLFEFILAHGFLELSIIAVAAGCGLYIGDALLNPGPYTRKEALQRHARPAIDVVLFSALCLIPAGLTEGYISPYEEVPFAVKLTIGILLAAVYWSFLLTGRWFPVPRRGFISDLSASAARRR